ncbi:MAG: protease PrsW [Ignavibacteriales bacterium]|nr:MAG: protease PrsW [Ignavibacteriales bacterium]
MFIILSAAAAIFPMIVYLYLIWRFDRYDKEPVPMVLRNYLWGGLGAIVFSIIGSDLLYAGISLFITDEIQLNYIQTVLIAPVVEESTKGIFLFLTIAGKKFDNITDGIVYGGAIGLGFGMTENFLYFITYGDTFQNWIMIVVVRTLFSGVMHCVSTATLGAFLGYAKFRDFGIKILSAGAGFSIAVFIHFLWNLSVSYQDTTLLGFIFLGASVIVMFVVFSISVAGEKKIIFNELSEEVTNGLIPADHLLILNSSKRKKFGWIDENIRRLYVIAATTLAFRKMQYKNSNGKQKLFCEREIEYYRSYIQLLLSTGFDKV